MDLWGRVWWKISILKAKWGPKMQEGGCSKVSSKSAKSAIKLFFQVQYYSNFLSNHIINPFINLFGKSLHIKKMQRREELGTNLIKRCKGLLKHLLVKRCTFHSKWHDLAFYEGIVSFHAVTYHLNINSISHHNFPL